MNDDERKTKVEDAIYTNFVKQSGGLYPESRETTTELTEQLDAIYQEAGGPDWYKRLYAYLGSNNLDLSSEQFDRIMGYARQAAGMKEDLGDFRVKGKFRDGWDQEQVFVRPVLKVSKTAFIGRRGDE